jgi:hypothetical protein
MPLEPINPWPEDTKPRDLMDELRDALEPLPQILPGSPYLMEEAIAQLRAVARRDQSAPESEPEEKQSHHWTIYMQLCVLTEKLRLVKESLVPEGRLVAAGVIDDAIAWLDNEKERAR